MDTGAAFTGSAGNDTFNATVATLGALDVIDAGAGTDTLSVVETNSITTWGDASLTGFEIAKVSSTGNIGSIASAAATTPNAAAVQQIVDFTLATPTATTKYDVTIGGNKYTTDANGNTLTEAQAWTIIKAVLSAKLADEVTFDDTYFQVKSKIAGSPLPSIAIALNTSTGTASISSTTATNGSVANVVGTAPVAIAETKTITLGTSAAVADVFTLSVNGADYTFSPSAATLTAAGDALATTLNSILGAGSATNAAGVVTVKALTAGTPLPLMNLTTDGSASTVITAGIANKAANVVASSAKVLAAPTGVTSYTATATGAANVSGAATTDITASGTVVQTSVGKDVTVTASDSVFVSGAKGAVTITATGATSTTLVGSVSATTATGKATDAAGVYVTGGTAVTITGSKDTSTVQVGAAPFAKDAVSTTGYPQTNGNSSKTPTGDVSVTNVTAKADTTTGVLNATYATGAASVYTNGAATVTVKGAGTTTITDAATQTLKSTAEATAVAGTSKLATVNLAGLSNTATIKSDAISTISVADTQSAQSVIVQNSGTTGANAGAINLQVSNVGTSSTRVTLDHSTATSVNVSSAAASAYGSVGGTTVNSGSKSWITLTTPKATSVTMTNSLAVDIGDTTAAGMAKVATINASGATGAVTATIGNTSDYGMTFTGGAGADSVTLKVNSTIAAAAQDGVTVKTSINLGAGNDKVLNAGLVGGTSTSGASSADERVATVSTGAVLDGGDGTDTVSVSLINSGNAAQFTNFETLDLKGSVNNASANATGSFDASLLTGSTITGIAVSGNLGNTAGGTTYTAGYTVSKISGTNITLTTTDTGTTAGSVTATLATSTGTADTASVVFNATSTTTDATSILTLFKTSGIETVSVSSGGALGTATAKVANTLTTFEDSSNTTASITITGTQAFTLGGVLQNNAAPSTTASNVAAALKTIDGSAATGVLTITAGSDDELANNTAVSTVFDGLTITGGSGADVLRNDAKGGVVNGGAGNDSITLTAAATAAGVKSTANGGDGDDTITVNGQVSTTLTGGAGKDTFDLTAAYGSGVVTTITDYVLGTDTVKVTGSNSLAKATTTSGTYDALLTAASTQTSDSAVWFQFDGNTFIVADTSSDAADVVVKLVGLFNLTSATAVTGLIGEA